VNRIHSFIALLLLGSIAACDSSETDTERRTNALKKRCARSDSDSCYLLGRRALEGEGGDRDLAAARRYFGGACEKGHIKACHNLGLLWRDGNGGPADEHKARALFQKACDKNNAHSCAQLGAMGISEGTERDRAEARAALNKACGLGIAEACNAFAVMCGSGVGGPKDLAGAWRGYFSACESGMEESCGRLAALAIVDPRILIYDSCKSGDSKACLFLGKMADDGIGGPKNREEARAYYAVACEAQSAPSCNNLGEMWAQGTGGPTDLTKATHYFDLACQKDGLKGCANLALFAEWDNDFGRARALRERACYNGEKVSCGRLAWFWSWGWGGPKDAARADRMYRKACDLGDEQSCRILKGNDR
jgi:TPR repeat protein